MTLDKAALLAWLRTAADTRPGLPVQASYEGLATRITAGQFDTPEGGEDQ